MKKRMFIAIDIPEVIKKTIVRFQNELKKSIDAKWIAPNNLHLTLIFLGEIEEENQSMIEKILNDFKKFNQFRLKVQGFGGFPNLNNPNVLWIGIKNSKDLSELQNFLSNRLKEKKFMIEGRIFVGHLTIARIKTRINLKNLKKYQDQNWGELPVKKIALYQSELLKEGPRHKKCFEIELKPEKF